MWSISRSLLVVLMVGLACSSYLEFQLMRLPGVPPSGKREPIHCKDEKELKQDADYQEVCYEKDIAHVIPMVKNNETAMIAADFSTPISWLKGPDCVIDKTNKPCRPIHQTFLQEVKEVKHKIAKKLHKGGKHKAEQENAVIEGASQVIRGELEVAKSLSFTIKDSNRLNSFFELIMLGLFIYGERDHLSVESANFVDATSISANLNSLSDGAISLRFDEASENSFLNEVFNYVKAKEKTVTVFIGENMTLTIGDLTAKYTKTGYSSIQWIDMPDDEGKGKFPHISEIGFEAEAEDEEDQGDETLPAVVTLSASYIGLPQIVINDIFSKPMMKKLATCKINEKTLYTECTASTKKNVDKFLERHIYFTFSQRNIMIPLQSLKVKVEGKKVILNIKQTFNNHAIMGEPLFQHYFCVFDYSKNRMGFAPKRETFNEFFISVVSLVRFLCFVFTIGCSFIICYGPCRKMMKALVTKRYSGKGGHEGRRLRQYKPIDENPYDDLKGKIQDAISSTDREEAEGI